MKGIIKKANIGKTVDSFLQLDNLIKNKRSVIWNRTRVPAAIIQNQQYRVVKGLIEKKLLKVYIKNKV